MTQGPDDVDPTGVRELLRALPPPGPMPADVTDGIRGALAAAAADTHPVGSQPGAPGSGPDSIVPGLDDRPQEFTQLSELAELEDDQEQASGDGVTRLDERRRHGRRPVWPFVAAAAASVLALAVGGAMLSAGRRSTPATASVLPASRTVSTTAAPAPVSAKIQLLSSARTYSSTRLAVQAQDLLDQPSGLSPTGNPAWGAIGTPEGLAACIATIGEGDADHVTVDLAVYDGQPAAIIVAVTGGIRQVYVVQRSCSQGDPAILQEPIPMN